MLAASASADTLSIPLAPGGALLLYRSVGSALVTLSPTVQRAVLADLTLPLERNRLMALVQHVGEPGACHGSRANHGGTPSRRAARARSEARHRRAPSTLLVCRVIDYETQLSSWRFQANCGHVKHSAKAPAPALALRAFFLFWPTDDRPDLTCPSRPRRRRPTRSHPAPTSRALADRVLVYDGAMGTNIQRHHPTPEDFGGKSLEGCNDHLVLTRPDIIQSIHESFLAVGCDVVETCTFQSTPHRLREWGIEEKTRELNVAAARLARAACDKYATPDKPRFVAGSIGPTGMLLSSSDPVLSKTTFAELEENYYTQAKYLVEGGVDVLLVETAQDILEVKAAVAGFERLFAEIGRRVADSGAGHARHERPDAARHRHRQRHDDARGAARRRHRAELLDRARSTCASRSAFSRRTRRARCRASRTPACRSTPAPATRSIRSSRSRWRRCSASSSSSSACASSAGAAARRRSISRRS